MCSLVMSLCSRDVITIIFYGSRLTGLTCSKAPGFWMVEHQLVIITKYKLKQVDVLSSQTSQPGSRPGREILVINSHAAVKAHAGSMHTHHFKQNLLKMALPS